MREYSQYMENEAEKKDEHIFFVTKNINAALSNKILKLKITDSET